ncbi:MAG: nickel-type superoxide dismutase maturation protease [Caldilineae bacterium]|nr:MAG: nickel-type superoxide dismutase maturation protease [Caldilineae bacterium]
MVHRQLNASELLLWLFRRRRRFRVNGDSMRPLLEPGDEVLVDPRAYRRTPPQIGDVVIARHPFRRDVRLIKRVTKVLDGDRYELRGDNPAASTDSRTFGAVPRRHLLGKVTARWL